jgi:hypothetical protein
MDEEGKLFLENPQLMCSTKAIRVRGKKSTNESIVFLSLLLDN